MKTVLSQGVVVTGDEHQRVLAPGDVVIEDDLIAFVGSSYEGDADVRIAAQGKLIMPGLINAHTHSPMSIFRSLADDVDLQVFLEQRVWPREVKLAPSDVYAGTLISAVEMLKSGVTTYVDMYFFEENSAQAAVDAGIRALITPGIIQSPAWEPVIGNWEQRTRSVADFCSRWQGQEGRIHTGFGPHAPYTLPFESLGEIARAARDIGAPVHIHLLETMQERDNFGQQRSETEIEALEKMDFFAGPVIAAHSIWLDEPDIDRYTRASCGVVHCPQSNCKLGAGIAPVAKMLALGVQVGLGTDGAATNNNLDLWEEMRLAPLLAKVAALDPKPIPAVEALAMATRMGARAIHLPGIGVLQEGLKADIVLLALEETSVPIFSPETYIDHLVYSIGREAVDSVWVNGKQVVKAGEVLTLDENEVRRAAQQAALDVSERVAA